MEKMPLLVRFVGGMGLYYAFVWLCMHVVLMLRPAQWIIAVLGFLFLLGFVFTVVSAASGSAKVGWLFFRMWVGFIGGGLIALGPFAIIPHMATLVLGAVLGCGFATWCITGKFKWIV